MGNCCSSEPEIVKTTPASLGNTVSTPQAAVSNTNRPATAEEDRQARLDAAERRAQENKSRGVQQGGGSLAKKLEEQQKIKPGAIPIESKDYGNINAANWN
jgi:hypothetical protein